MANIKRAVSPLIATILLVALTVSIGAMVIGWGRQYVQQQTSCLGYKIDIYEAKYNPSADRTIPLLYNSGTQKLHIRDTIVKIVDKNGRSWTCFYEGVLVNNTTTGCAIENFSNNESTIDPGRGVRAIIRIGNDNLKSDIVGGYMWIEVRGCGRISENAIIE